MPTNQIVVLIATVSIIAWVTILLPTIVYLITDWRARRDQLFSILDEDALVLYYQKFFPALNERRESVRSRFKKDFYRLYGRRHYLIPLIFLATVSGLGMWGTEETVRFWLTGTSSFKLPAIAISAFLGSYAWVLSDQFGRYESRNFTKHDIYRGVYRFLITVPIGFSLAAFVKDDFGVPVAFLIGTFPTQTLLKFGRRLVVDQIGLGGQTQDAEDGPNELILLQGIDRENAERFQSVGLTTIVSLAWFDPIELTIRTNLEFNYVIDCISQALVWVYFGKDTPKLYNVSLRGAQEARYLWVTLGSDKPLEREAATQTLKKAAEILNTNETSLRHTLDVIADDPYSEFLAGIWGGGTSGSDGEQGPRTLGGQRTQGCLPA